MSQNTYLATLFIKKRFSVIGILTFCQLFKNFSYKGKFRQTHWTFHFYYQSISHPINAIFLLSEIKLFLIANNVKTVEKGGPRNAISHKFSRRTDVIQT